MKEAIEITIEVVKFGVTVYQKFEVYGENQKAVNILKEDVERIKNYADTVSDKKIERTVKGLLVKLDSYLGEMKELFDQFNEKTAWGKVKAGAKEIWKWVNGDDYKEKLKTYTTDIGKCLVEINTCLNIQHDNRLIEVQKSLDVGIEVLGKTLGELGEKLDTLLIETKETRSITTQTLETGQQTLAETKIIDQRTQNIQKTLEDIKDKPSGERREVQAEVDITTMSGTFYGARDIEADEQRRIKLKGYMEDLKPFYSNPQDLLAAAEEQVAKEYAQEAEKDRHGPDVYLGGSVGTATNSIIVGERISKNPQRAIGGGYGSQQTPTTEQPPQQGTNSSPQGRGR